MSEFDRLYFQFEERFRGSRGLIRERLEVYRPLIDQTLEIVTRRKAIDYACGRGEWLELLQAAGWSARGVDLNDDMLSSCRAFNLEVEHADAIAHSSALAESCEGLITAFHLVEHLPIEQVFILARNAHRALCESGMLIFETPNPENLMTGTCWFYMDPTHVRPLPPELLRFAVEAAGFSVAEVVRLNGDALASAGEATFASVVKHPVTSGPDYAVIAIKLPTADQSASLERFMREVGQPRPTDFPHAEALDARWTNLEDQIAGLREASTASSTAIAGLTDTHRNFDQQLSDLRNREDSAKNAINELRSYRSAFEEQSRRMAQDLSDARAIYAATISSRSWVITAPLRWLSRVLFRRS